MKYFTKITFIIFISVLFISGCAKIKGVATDVEVNDFVWKGLNAYYLHQDKIPNLSDRRFSSDQELNNYLRSFPDANSLFTSLLINNDNKSILIEDFNTIQEPAIRTSFTNGMEYGIIADKNHPNNVFGYVLAILPNSDASVKNIFRGDFFYAVDGVQLTRDNYANLLVTGNNSYTLHMANINSSTFAITPNNIQINLEKKVYNHTSIFLEKTFAVGAKNIGYLLYNNDFSANYTKELNNVFQSFKNQNVNELILDFRYSIGTGGFAKTVTQFASMLTGQFQTTETLIKEKWNVKAQPWFKINQPDSLLTKFPEKLDATTDFAKLQLTDVYIVLNGNSFTGSSFTELLINSLKPYINVHVIGNKTIGNNTGSITLYNSIDYDSIGRSVNHTYALQPIVLEFYNKEDQTYVNGITPEIQLCSIENIFELGVLGEATEPILQRVLGFVTTGSIGINPLCNPSNLEHLYHSINAQRQQDKGMFIKQNLPNTDNRVSQF